MTSICMTKPSNCKEAAEVQVSQDAITKESDVWKTMPEPIVELQIDFEHVADVIIEESKPRFGSREFSQKEGINFIDNNASIARVFKVHEQDTHDSKLKMLAHEVT